MQNELWASHNICEQTNENNSSFAGGIGWKRTKVVCVESDKTFSWWNENSGKAFRATKAVFRLARKPQRPHASRSAPSVTRKNWNEKQKIVLIEHFSAFKVFLDCKLLMDAFFVRLDEFAGRRSCENWLKAQEFLAFDRRMTDSQLVLQFIARNICKSKTMSWLSAKLQRVPLCQANLCKMQMKVATIDRNQANFSSSNSFFFRFYLHEQEQGIELSSYSYSRKKEEIIHRARKLEEFAGSSLWVTHRDVFGKL